MTTPPTSYDVAPDVGLLAVQLAPPTSLALVAVRHAPAAQVEAELVRARRVSSTSIGVTCATCGWTGEVTSIWDRSQLMHDPCITA